MDWRRHEVMSQRMHGNEWGKFCGVAMVVGIVASCDFGASRGFNCDKLCFFLCFLRDFVIVEWPEQAAKAAASADAAVNRVRVIVDHRQLLLCFETSDGLVHADVVEHASDGIVCFLVCFFAFQ